MNVQKSKIHSFNKTITHSQAAIVLHVIYATNTHKPIPKCFNDSEIWQSSQHVVARHTSDTVFGLSSHIHHNVAAFGLIRSCVR